MPLSVVSIGVAFKGSVYVGVIYDPYREELISAIKGQGTRINGGERIYSSDASIDSAVIAVGTSSTKEAFTPECRAIPVLLDKGRAVRSFGSACLQLSWVSRGLLDCFYELDLNSWDLAAGSLLVTGRWLPFMSPSIHFY